LNSQTYTVIAVEDPMFLGMQDFDFAQISLKFAQKNFPWVCGCIPSSYGTVYSKFNLVTSFYYADIILRFRYLLLE